MNLKTNFIAHLTQNFPELNATDLDGYVSDQLVSPFQVPIKRQLIEDIKKEIQGFWKLRSWSADHLAAQYANKNLAKPNNYAACMSYDFHVNPNGQLELIEINTNASFLALGLLLYSFWKIKNEAANFGDKELIQMFLDEAKLAGAESKNPSIAIIDETPEQQRLYLEFLIYQSLFKKSGLQSAIHSFSEVEKLEKFDLVYNRFTDFYLDESKSKQLKASFVAGQVKLSPNPYEYFLLADKQRLIDWYGQTDMAKPASLLPVYDMQYAPIDKMWAERKNLFFKPKTSFGSKQAYRGASMSKKAFESVCHPDFIAQQVSFPSELSFVSDAGAIKLKYDLRCYAYKDQLQLIVARLYQGQTTNLRTEGGGFACVRVID